MSVQCPPLSPKSCWTPRGSTLVSGQCPRLGTKPRTTPYAEDIRCPRLRKGLGQCRTMLRDKPPTFIGRAELAERSLPGMLAKVRRRTPRADGRRESRVCQAECRRARASRWKLIGGRSRTRLHIVAKNRPGSSSSGTAPRCRVAAGRRPRSRSSTPDRSPTNSSPRPPARRGSCRGCSPTVPHRTEHADPFGQPSARLGRQGCDEVDDLAGQDRGDVARCTEAVLCGAGVPVKALGLLRGNPWQHGAGLACGPTAGHALRLRCPRRRPVRSTRS